MFSLLARCPSIQTCFFGFICSVFYPALLFITKQKLFVFLSFVQLALLGFLLERSLAAGLVINYLVLNTVIFILGLFYQSYQVK